ncbi:FAD-dependent 5-carboxymethylaminomethyl-2-thiouridine(34) oxidoreductase MnmC [Comamonas endophytica]|uniref:tRNA 5-methylaminomethyl-2-thiouridine biosynthesis bifunctional protein MnmC n=1 Tax=Comamonas endophytica TaxID=2949090 RepID=A0ABY6GBL8_9BURK|nr:MULTISPECIES: FAD-dependent 5-carboxymethylaminomethyl-2-thiouridine(34) oxidoreductase MnmC [unclassified Acidovorax]MCD2512080.1 FAD-dependent 5-carboxymethylaminomethyl-2-thiouridine(34) oxidoreductase MnmC [Acidovorax sp. D4N7]UYG51859.1 FAD-dependent 5-carboxymethylaminomethyl-2-thiouridine(34) oxidoreductase MnmC [Acidovorax sp. 5MLIR]
MPEPIDWLPDGTPYSPRFGDRYHSENGGLDQARQVFLAGCGLPEAWADQPMWRILETGFGFGLNFLVTWAAWKAAPQRPQLLHFVSTEAFPVAAEDMRRAMPQDPALRPLAEQLAAQFWGLLPGVHRLSFEGGQVQLTLYVGDAQTQLRQQMPTADSIYLDGFSPARNPEIWDPRTLKAVARCCRRGTRLATWTIARAVRDALAENGFQVRKMPGVPPKRDNLQALFDPRWEPRRRPDPWSESPAMPDARHCIVLGGGLAGAAVAFQLAQRGWRVDVLDQAEAPAAGASGLPAGLFAPHVSPDDSVLSRLSRSGVRATLQQARALLEPGRDWLHCGVLEHRVESTDGLIGLPREWQLEGPGAMGDSRHPGRDWSRPADAAQRALAGLDDGAAACWHAQAGWIRPARLVRALLNRPGIAWHGGREVARLQRDASDTRWQLLDAQGQPLAEAALVVIAGGHGSDRLLPAHWPLQRMRGQVSWGEESALASLPPFPVNGKGSLVPHIPLDTREAGWFMGSSFERDVDQLPPSPADQAQAHAANAERLRTLLPLKAPALAPAFAATPRLWAGVRLASHDRLPLVGPVDPAQQPGLWACTAMGARGITLALLCAELLAARLHGEPLPLDARLAQALSTGRLRA